MTHQYDETLLSKPGTDKGRLQREVLRVLLEHERDGALPTSNRFVFYELVMRGAVDKAKSRRNGGRGSDQDVSDASFHLREIGAVPWPWIVDETRELHQWRQAGTVADYVLESLDTARVNCWGDEDPPLLLCESRTFGGVLRRTIAPEYLCPVAATNGQVGGFLRTDIAPLLEITDRKVLYIGDYDWSGHQIETNTKRVRVREAEWDGEWTRLALTDEQVAARPDLPRVEKGDRRYTDGRPHEAIEVESLGQTVVENIVRDALDALLPEPLEDVHRREEEQRERVRAVLQTAERAK